MPGIMQKKHLPKVNEENWFLKSKLKHLSLFLATVTTSAPLIVIIFPTTATTITAITTNVIVAITLTQTILKRGLHVLILLMFPHQIYIGLLLLPLLPHSTLQHIFYLHHFTRLCLCSPGREFNIHQSTLLPNQPLCSKVVAGMAQILPQSQK